MRGLFLSFLQRCECERNTASTNQKQSRQTIFNSPCGSLGRAEEPASPMSRCPLVPVSLFCPMMMPSLVEAKGYLLYHLSPGLLSRSSTCRCNKTDTTMHEPRCEIRDASTNLSCPELLPERRDQQLFGMFSYQCPHRHALSFTESTDIR
jgi:hypothetical protein